MGRKTITNALAEERKEKKRLEEFAIQNGWKGGYIETYLKPRKLKEYLLICGRIQGMEIARTIYQREKYAKKLKEKQEKLRREQDEKYG